MGFSSIPLDISRIIFLINPLVIGSTKIYLDLTYSKEITPSFNNCLNAPRLMRLCLFFILLYTLFLSIPITGCESQWRETGESCLPHKSISAKRFLSHSASCPANSRAMNSDSMVECAIQVCLEDFHEIAPARTKCAIQLVELSSSLSNTQFPSQKPSKTAENFLKRKHHS